MSTNKLAPALAKIEQQLPILESAAHETQAAWLANPTDKARQAKAAAARALDEAREDAVTLAQAIAVAQAEESAIRGAEQVAALEVEYQKLHAERLAKIAAAHQGIIAGLAALADAGPEGIQFARHVLAGAPGFGSFLSDFVVPENGGIAQRIAVMENEARSISSATGCNPFARVDVASPLAKVKGA